MKHLPRIAKILFWIAVLVLAVFFVITAAIPEISDGTSIWFAAIVLLFGLRKLIIFIARKLGHVAPTPGEKKKAVLYKNGKPMN